MTKPKYRRLTYDDRRVIENMCKAKKTQSEIAKALGVSQSTISANYHAIVLKAFTRMAEHLCERIAIITQAQKISNRRE